MSRVGAIIIAAGSGSRMNMNTTKQKLSLGGMTVLKRSVLAFAGVSEISNIVVAVRQDEVEFAQNELFGIEKVSEIVVGGDTRLASTRRAFSALPADVDYVAIHDAARCLVTVADINAVISDAEKYGAATAATRVTDTVKRIDGQGNITETLNRDELVTVQTPQIFRLDLYKKAISAEESSSAAITDDNMLLEKLGYAVHCTFTGAKNIKITVSDDIAYANFLLNGDN